MRKWREKGEEKRGEKTEADFEIDSRDSDRLTP